MKTLILLPNLLDENSSWRIETPFIDALIAESQSGGYQYLKKWGYSNIPIYLLNEHTTHISDLLQIPEKTVGLISDAGLTCLADPGSDLVLLAQQHNIHIVALPGPCSFLMALQLSGLNGQSFIFHGYLPIEKSLFSQKLKKLDPDYTHLFIETPYRFEKSLERCLQFLNSQDYLCVALELMGKSQWVKTCQIQQWKMVSLPKGKLRPVFIIQKAPSPDLSHQRSIRNKRGFKPK